MAKKSHYLSFPIRLNIYNDEKKAGTLQITAGGIKYRPVGKSKKTTLNVTWQSLEEK